MPLGYSSPSIGGIESGECNKSFNGGPTKSYSVDFKDSWHEAMDCFEFFWPRGVLASGQLHRMHSFYSAHTHNAART